MNNLDNTPDIWAKDAIDWASGNNIIVGNDNGNLQLHNPISKQDAIVLLHRVYELMQRGG